MKQLLIALTLLAAVPAIAHEPSEAIQAQIIALAKIKALHATTLEEYSLVEELYNACAESYLATHDQFEMLTQSADTHLRAQVDRSRLKEVLESIAPKLESILDGVQEINQYMATFNEMKTAENPYTQLAKALIQIRQYLEPITEELEVIKQELDDIQTMLHRLKSLSPAEREECVSRILEIIELATLMQNMTPEELEKFVNKTFSALAE